MFTLIVDDFGVKVTSEGNATHIIDTIQKYYKIKIEREGKHYLGMDLEWDYIKRTLEVAMQGYVQSAYKQFNHKKTKQPVHGPTKFTPPKYGAKIQHSEEDLPRPMKPQERKLLEKVVDFPLYYVRAEDVTMMYALNELASQISKVTKKSQCHEPFPRLLCNLPKCHP